MIGRALEFLVTRVLARAFPSRYRVIPRKEDGAPLLRQFKICSWAYLQSFACPESLDDFHCHRWKRMISFVLSGAFVEERYPGEIFVPHLAPSIYTMSDTTIHRLAGVEPRTWTLFCMFGTNRQAIVGDTSWGYLPRPDYTYRPWDYAIPDERKVKSL